VQKGRKYAKILVGEKHHAGTTRHTHIHSFVDLSTGDIFKPASFNAPAKHARGSVMSEQIGAEALTEMGTVRYLK
jgi:hypothetical protein